MGMGAAVGLVTGAAFFAGLAYGMRIALRAQDGFSKLLATGLTFGFALQTFIIVGGVVAAPIGKVDVAVAIVVGVLVVDPLAAQLVDRVGKDIEALFHHQPAVEADQHFVIADPQAAAPFH